MLNMPDLGRAPIVLQNTTYRPKNASANEAARKIELAGRLSELTRYHNQQLFAATVQLRKDLVEAEILYIDADQHFQRLSGRDKEAALQPQDFGYAPAAMTASLRHQGRQLSLPQPCYTGSYLGTRDATQLCANPEQALFWDSVHPTTLTQCWQAYQIGGDMAAAGWIRPLPNHATYRQWCQTIVDRVVMDTVEAFAPGVAADE